MPPVSVIENPLTQSAPSNPPSPRRGENGHSRPSVLSHRPEAGHFPPRRAWTLAEFEHASEAGIFGPEERLELIEGELFQKMTQNSLHAVTITLCLQTLLAMGGGHFHTRVQLPLTLGDNRPEPDLAVVQGAPRDYIAAHPQTAELIIEVSDTTLAFDRTTKQGLYAQAGIADYWIVNLNDRTLEVYRQPAPTEEHPFDHHYRSLTTFSETDTVTPLAAPELLLRVADLLP